jgi:hypothetical protein
MGLGMKKPNDLETRDTVNHPRHYTSHPSGVECIDIVEWFPHNVGAAIKYLWRHGLKYPPTITTQAEVHAAAREDLKKARWYIDREIQRLELRQGR